MADPKLRRYSHQQAPADIGVRYRVVVPTVPSGRALVISKLSVFTEFNPVRIYPIITVAPGLANGNELTSAPLANNLGRAFHLVPGEPPYTETGLIVLAGEVLAIYMDAPPNVPTANTNAATSVFGQEVDN